MYPIWYCEEYPVEAIRISKLVPREGREKWRLALAEDIRKHGLVNPLIILNHRGDKHPDGHHWLMTGTNRHWAIQHLGWKTVPCIVTGDCEFSPKVVVYPDKLQEYFPDGEVYFGTHGPRLRATCSPENYEYPKKA